MEIQQTISSTFGIEAPDTFTCSVFNDDKNPHIPTKNGDYYFRREVLRDVLAFLQDPAGDAFYLFGPHGSGKTTVSYQIASRLNYPVQTFTAHSRMEFDDLVGMWKMNNGNMEYIYGPLSIAMKEGHLLIINEIDRADPGQLAGLNDILEGHPLVIPTNGGETIYPHENFRFIANGNSSGGGDPTGLYQGVQQLDIAFMDRFRLSEVNYLPQSEEEKMLEKIFPALPKTIRENMVTVANKIRTLFIGGEETATPLTITMSTRTICRWAKLTLTFRQAPNALEYALEQSLLARAEPEQKIAITQIASDVFGSHWSGGL